MSNCVEIRNGTGVLRLSAAQVDAEALRSFIEAVEAEGEPECLPPAGVDREGYLRRINAWWFLTPRNVRFVGDGSVEIRFGEGRSTHTQRDLRAMVWLLAPFMRAEVLHFFALADEYDRFEKVAVVPFWFGR